jgi:hypothetical protein
MAVTDPTAIGGQGAGGAPTATLPQTTTPAPYNYTGTNMPGYPDVNAPVSSDLTNPQYTNTQPASPSFWQQAGQFMQSPTGQMIQAGIPVATGFYGAQQANQNIQNLTNQLRGVAAPQVQYGQNVLSQMQGGAPVAGPAGQVIGSQLQGAQALSQAAQPYASGQLTQGQQLALQQAAQGAAARTNLAFSMSGDPLSSANVASQQAIADQSIIAAGQIQQQNIQFAQQALQSAQSVYNGILQQSFSSAQLGISAYQPAMQAQINADQQISQQTQQLMSQIAQGLTGSSPSGPGGPSAGQAFGSAISKWLQSGNQSGAVNPTSPTFNQPQSTDVSNVVPGAGPGGTSYSPDVSAPDVTPTTSDTTSTLGPSGSDQVSSDFQFQLPGQN